MFKKLIRFIKSILKSNTVEGITKFEYHFQINTNADNDSYMVMNHVEGPIPEKGETGVVYIGKIMGEHFIWTGTEYQTLAAINTDPIITKIQKDGKTVKVVELPFPGTNGIIYGLKDPDGWARYFEWDSEKNEYAKTEVSLNESKPNNS